jgi:hypothetical protein
VNRHLTSIKGKADLAFETEVGRQVVADSDPRTILLPAPWRSLMPIDVPRKGLTVQVRGRAIDCVAAGRTALSQTAAARTVKKIQLR